jgi:hypothetical protein
MRPVSHSSLISAALAETRRRREASFGNSVATRVRRCSSRLSRSSAFVVRKRRRCGSGNAKTARPSGTFASLHSASFGAGRWYSLDELSPSTDPEPGGAASGLLAVALRAPFARARSCDPRKRRPGTCRRARDARRGSGPLVCGPRAERDGPDRASRTRVRRRDPSLDSAPSPEDESGPEPTARSRYEFWSARPDLKRRPSRWQRVRSPRSDASLRLLHCESVHGAAPSGASNVSASLFVSDRSALHSDIQAPWM